MLRVLETSIEKVDKIFHIGDVHIRTYKRHKEYVKVFEKVEEYIRDNKTNNSIIYVAGDIVHSKTDMSPEIIFMLSRFLKGLTELCPTLMILGNHDTNLNNSSRIDALQPIVDILDDKNLYFLSENGYYKFAQIGFNVMEVSTHFSEYLTADGLDTEIKIALFHGAVDKSTTDMNIKMTNNDVTWQTFIGHDITLLGDIHKRQVVCEDPLIVYCGSMIQQNHSETLDRHGLLEWDLDTKTFTEVDIENEYGYYTLEVEGGKIINWSESIPKRPRLRIRYKDTPLDRRKEIEAEVRTKRSVEEWTVQSANSLNSQNIHQHKVNIGNVRDVEYQNKLITEFLIRKNIAENVINEVVHINRDINTRIADSDIVRNILWKPTKFTFSNMFSYGEDNLLDFANMGGTYGIFAPNAAGKCVDEKTTIDIEYSVDDIINMLGYLPEELNIESPCTVTIKRLYDIFTSHGDLGINVDTPYGYKKILACEVTAKDSQVLKISTDSFSLEGSPDHKVKTDRGFQPLKDIIHSDQIHTINGMEKVSYVRTLPDKRDLYDIQVEDVEQYYSNGILSHNSTLLDSLCFCLFDKCSKTKMAGEVLNRVKDYFECQLEFTIDDKPYVIYKKGTKKSDGKVKVDIDFYTFKDGEKVSLNGDQRMTTNKSIGSHVGAYEDFILTALSVQNNGTNFIEKSQKERRDLLAEFLDIKVFEELAMKAVEEVRDTRAVLKTYQSQDIPTKLSTAINNNEIFESEKSEIEEKVEQENILLEGEYLKQKSLIESKKTINNYQRIKGLEDSIPRHKDELAELTRQYKALPNLDELKHEYNNLTKEIEEYGSEDVLKENHQNLLKLTTEKQSIKGDINNIEYKISQCKKLIEHLESHEYDPNCNFCVKHPTVKQGEKSKEELKEHHINQKELQDKFERISSDISVLEKAGRDLNELYKLKSKYSTLEHSIKSTEYNQEQYKDRIIKLRESIKTDVELVESLMKEDEEAINYNQYIETQIKEVDSVILRHKYNLSQYNKELMTVVGSIASNNTVIEDCREKINTLQDLDLKSNAYESYIQAVRSNGVPYDLIRIALPEIQEEVNNVLHQLVDFEVILDTDNKNINAYIVYDEVRSWPLEATSGMEKFISSLAIRSALIANTSLPKPNFISIDEGFGVLDSEHLVGMATLFDILKQDFDFVFCISHLDTMKDVVDKYIEITKIDNLSRVYCN